MSLKEAVLEVVQNMEDDLKEADLLQEPEDQQLVKGYIRALKSACKAAADVPQGQKLAIDPTSQHIIEIEKARAEFRKKPDVELLKEDKEEAHKILTIADGPHEGVSHVMPADMPEGAKTSINGDVYQLREGKLHHVPDGQKRE